MFDIGFWELFLILILALLVVGPERLPKAARTAGYWFGKARRYVEGVKEEVASEFDVGELKRMVHNQEVQINELQQKLKSGVEEVGSDVSKELPSSEILTDVPAHSFHDEQPDDEQHEYADESSDVDKEKS